MEVALVWWLMAIGQQRYDNSAAVLVPVPFQSEQSCAEAAKYVDKAFCIPQPKRDIDLWEVKRK